MAKYSDEYRASCIAMLTAEGYPDRPAAIRKVLAYLRGGSPCPNERTLRYWWNLKHQPAPEKLIRQEKKTLAEKFELAANKYVDHSLQDEIVAELSGKDAMITAATATDKMQLLRGLPTSIVQVLPDLVAAMENAGLNASDVFNNMLARLNAQASKVG